MILPVKFVVSEALAAKKPRPYNDLLQAVPNPQNHDEMRLFYAGKQGQTLIAETYTLDAFQHAAKLSLTRPILKLTHSRNNGTHYMLNCGIDLEDDCMAMMTSTDLSVISTEKLYHHTSRDFMVTSNCTFPTLPADVMWSPHISNEGYLLLEDGSVCSWQVGRKL